MKKDLRQLLGRCRSMGCAIHMRKSGHYLIRLPSGVPVYCPATPSDHRGLRNVIAELRRKGLPI